MNVVSSRVRRASAFFGGVAAFSVSTAAFAHQPPPRYPRLRPTLEVSSWVSLGGGALTIASETRAVFDLRLGGDFTAAVGRKGDVRVGPFVEVASATFETVQTVGGVELFLGAIPRPLRMFYYSGEGVFSARVGGGWAWRAWGGPAAESTPVASVTLAYGYRAPFSLREPENEWGDEPEQRSLARYMVSVRLWVNATVDLRDAPGWQLTGGIEFEPVGSFRYLLGIN